MTQNDFLNRLFSMNLFFVTLLTWFWGFGSLFVYAVRTDSVTTVLLRHPGIMIGDFFLIPFSMFLITYFYQHVDNPVDLVVSNRWNYMILPAIFLTLVSAVRYDLLNIWFFPHSLFYCFMVYVLLNFFPKGLLQLVKGASEKYLWLIWFGIVLVLFVHELIPNIFGAKTFPKL